LHAANPDYFNTPDATFLPPRGTPLALNQVRYITNPSPSDGVVDPTDAANPYFDSEYQQDAFPPISITSGTLHVKTIPSVSGNNLAGLPGPLYKWVRINAVTEKSLNLQVDSTNPNDSTTPLYYDYGHVPRPSLIVPVGAPPGTAVQALEITSLAVLPNGSQKILQYVVAGSSLSLQFPAALTLVGNGVQFIPESEVSFAIDGNDQFNAGSCVVGAPPVYGVGFTSNADDPNILAAMNMPPGVNNYRGLAYPGPDSPFANRKNVIGPPPPGVQLLPNLQTAAGLTGLMQTIQSVADLNIPGNADQSSLPSVMLPSNPKTIFVNGDLDMTGWPGPGYGLLAVSGKLKYDGNVKWRGIILVIGQGTFTVVNAGSGEIDGAMLVAQINGGPPPGLGAAKVDFSNGSNGVFYSNCWIQAVLPNANNKVLSFREVPQ
jgi:hypothetical protein